MIRQVLVAGAVVVGLAVPAFGIVQTAPTASTFVDTLLRSHFRFSAEQIADVHKGRPVSVSLPGPIDREILAAGAVRINTPVETLLELFSNIEKLEVGAGFLKTVRISDPPREEDFSSLTLPRDDIHDLRRCREGDCKLKISPAALLQAAAIDWRAPDAEDRAQRFVRRMAFNLADTYLKQGGSAFPVSMDEKPPRQIASEFPDMLSSVGFVSATMPSLGTYLVRYPGEPKPPGLREYLYWSMVEFGLKATLRLNHVVLYPLNGGGPARWAMANRIIYANHYFQNGAEMRLVLDDPERPGRGHYLLVFNVARPDGVTGLFGGLVRYKVRNGSREALRKTLSLTKLRCESPADFNPRRR